MQCAVFRYSEASNTEHLITELRQIPNGSQFGIPTFIWSLLTERKLIAFGWKQIARSNPVGNHSYVIVQMPLNSSDRNLVRVWFKQLFGNWIAIWLLNVLETKQRVNVRKQNYVVRYSDVDSTYCIGLSAFYGKMSNEIKHLFVCSDNHWWQRC